MSFFYMTEGKIEKMALSINAKLYFLSQSKQVIFYGTLCIQRIRARKWLIQSTKRNVSAFKNSVSYQSDTIKAVSQPHGFVIVLISSTNYSDELTVYCNCGRNVNFAFLYTAIAVYTKRPRIQNSTENGLVFVENQTYLFNAQMNNFFLRSDFCNEDKLFLDAVIGMRFLFVFFRPAQAFSG